MHWQAGGRDGGGGVGIEIRFIWRKIQALNSKWTKPLSIEAWAGNEAAIV